MVRLKNSTYFSVSLTFQEKEQLDEAARAAGLPRNRLVRNWIATLGPTPPKGKRKA